MTTSPGSRSLSSRRATSASDELMTVLEMCAELKISRRTFYRWKAAGDVPDLIPFPGEFRAWRSDFQAWIIRRSKKRA